MRSHPIDVSCIRRFTATQERVWNAEIDEVTTGVSLSMGTSPTIERIISYKYEHSCQIYDLKAHFMYMPIQCFGSTKHIDTIRVGDAFDSVAVSGV